MGCYFFCSFPFLLIALSDQRRGAQMICVGCWAAQSRHSHNSSFSSGFRLLGFILGAEELPFILVVSHLQPPVWVAEVHTQGSQFFQELPPVLALAACPLLMVHFPSGSPLGIF